VAYPKVAFEERQRHLTQNAQSAEVVAERRDEGADLDTGALSRHIGRFIVASSSLLGNRKQAPFRAYLFLWLRFA
jgi:hypothetical protein